MYGQMSKRVEIYKTNYNIKTCSSNPVLDGNRQHRNEPPGTSRSARYRIYPTRATGRIPSQSRRSEISHSLPEKLEREAFDIVKMYTLRMASKFGGESALDLTPKSFGKQSILTHKFVHPPKIWDLKQANATTERWENPIRTLTAEHATDLGEKLKQILLMEMTPNTFVELLIARMQKTETDSMTTEIAQSFLEQRMDMDG